MAPHSSTLAWKIPWMEEPGRLQFMGSLSVRHNWATSLSGTGEGNGNPLQCSCLENPRDWGAWWVAIYGVAQSRTRPKRLSSSSILSQWLKDSPSNCFAFLSRCDAFCPKEVMMWIKILRTLKKGALGKPSYSKGLSSDQENFRA